MSLEGRLEDLALTDIFQIISLSRRSGILTLIRKEGTARLVFAQGQVMFASSDTRSRLGYTLVKKGLITNDELEYALRIQKGRGSVKPIGMILMEMGAVEQQTLERELREHIVNITKDLLDWDTGSFHFELGSPPEDDIALKVGLTVEYLLLEAARLKDEENRDRFEAPSAGSAPPQRTPGGSEDMETTQVIQPGRYTASRSSESSAPPVEESLSKPFPEKPRGAGKARKDLVLLTSMIAELSGPSTSSEITLMVLRFAGEIMNRAAILLVRKDDIVGIGQSGLNLPEASAQEQIRSIRIPLSEPSVFRDVVEKKMTYKSQLPQSKWHQYFMDKIGKEWPTEVFMAPLVCEGRVIALLYGDDVPGKEGISETEGLEAFIKVAGVAFGKALLERKFKDIQSS